MLGLLIPDVLCVPDGRTVHFGEEERRGGSALSPNGIFGGGEYFVVLLNSSMVRRQRAGRSANEAIEILGVFSVHHGDHDGRGAHFWSGWRLVFEGVLEFIFCRDESIACVDVLQFFESPRPKFCP
ncbi:hypothetical protein V2O64_18435 [Verrucomicrobiaceae bacterium 227]